jgi:hypothetical protein
MYRKWRKGNRCPLECWEMMQKQRNVFGKGTPHHTRMSNGEGLLLWSEGSWWEFVW